MELHEGSLPVCPSNRHCSKWARENMKYCLCGAKDGVSLTLGMLSVISWGVAEIPQIITNYKEKSAEGLSFAFLLTWIVGDLFNLIGCRLEPATLPTQFYMAILYTITTAILALQSIYYGHIYHRLPNKGPTQSEVVDKVISEKSTYTDGPVIIGARHVQSSPIPVASSVLSRYGSLGRDMFYTSARSLTKSRTPTVGSYLARSHGSDKTTIVPNPNPNAFEEPLLGDPVSAQSSPPSRNTKNMLCVISALTFFISSFDLHFSVNNRLNMVLEKPTRGVVIRIGRKLLKSSIHGSKSEENSEMGTILGWAMAAIYMGGRLPQICLNMRRGNVEGLNPLMFIFALLGNITYVGSILVSSLEWSKIRPNLPWLVDAGGCVILDAFIIIQFIHYHFRNRRTPQNNHSGLSTV